MREQKAQVPFLGSIPLLGELFKTRSVDKVKTNLMFFVRPRILRDGIDATIETNAKYNYIRKQQLDMFGGRVPLMPGEHQPALPAPEQMIPSDLLEPAQRAAPPGTTPAQRTEGAPGYVAPTDFAPAEVASPLNGPATGTPVTPAGQPPAKPTTPFGAAPATSPPPQPPPAGTTP
jgi:general secretion pathway protein D